MSGDVQPRKRKKEAAAKRKKGVGISESIYIISESDLKI